MFSGGCCVGVGSGEGASRAAGSKSQSLGGRGTPIPDVKLYIPGTTLSGNILNL